MLLGFVVLAVLVLQCTCTAKFSPVRTEFNTYFVEHPWFRPPGRPSGPNAPLSSFLHSPFRSQKSQKKQEEKKAEPAASPAPAAPTAADASAAKVKGERLT